MTKKDTWRDKDADSGLRLDHWLNETQDASRTMRMFRVGDELGCRWHAVLSVFLQPVAEGADEHLEQAWMKALDVLASREEDDAQRR